MAGYELVQYGGRFTYVPPFIHQEPSQCTMTAAQMAANVAHLGGLPTGQKEVRLLAKASGMDVMPDDGYNTKQMLKALLTRYDLPLDNVALTPDQWRTRLSSGWVGLLAVEYPLLPERFRLDANFLGGHRLLIAGHDPDRDQTMLIDPIRGEAGFKPEPIKLSKLYTALGRFSRWQVWLREGQALPRSIVVSRVFDEPVTIQVPARTKCTFVHRRGLVHNHQPGQTLTFELDRKGRRATGAEANRQEIYRIAGGDLPRLQGWWLKLPANVIVPEPGGRGPVGAANNEDGSYQEGFLAGVAEERARWEEWLEDGPRSSAPATSPAEAPDIGIGKGLG